MFAYARKMNIGMWAGKYCKPFPGNDEIAFSVHGFGPNSVRHHRRVSIFLCENKNVIYMNGIPPPVFTQFA